MSVSALFQKQIQQDLSEGDGGGGVSELWVTYCLWFCPIHCGEWGLTAVLLCLGALSDCGAPSSVLLSLLAW